MLIARKPVVPAARGQRNALWTLMTLALTAAGAGAAELSPVRLEHEGTRPIGRFSDRTVVAAVTVDRDSAGLIAFTLKERPFTRPLEVPQARAYRTGAPVQMEVVLAGPGGQSYTQRIDVRMLCFDHPGDAEPHIAGDTIRVHRESVLVEMPEIAGLDRLEIATHEERNGRPVRKVLASPRLSADRFTPAGASARYADLAFADLAAASTAPLTPGTVHWPEEYGDTVRYLVYGDEAETSRRINVVIVPDGYTFAQKVTMEAHAQALVVAFNNRTPYQEHTPFINYVLVYAYSTATGTDQCDCAIIRDTAMNTRFPRINAACQHSDNRCLYYGTGNGGPDCDPNTSETNIVAAELRAPAADTTLVMVNTPRYGGCGGYRGVYSAGNASATEVAIHELGHSLAGLADEYDYDTGCGTYAGEINTSLDPFYGAWPEWRADLGPPREGAEYYRFCTYRPTDACEMRSLFEEFCPVCNQQWALTFFGHPRVSPTAPLVSVSPQGNVTTQVGQPVDFSAVTRLAVGPYVLNAETWLLVGPGYPEPTEVAFNTASHTQVFESPGSYALTYDVVADINFVKQERFSTNHDASTWTIDVSPVPEVSDDPVHQLTLQRNGSTVDLRFEDTGSSRYNVYVSNAPGTSPFRVSSPADGKQDCDAAATSIGGGMKQVTGYDLDAGITGSTSLLFVLVTADNGPATEGALGTASSSIPRTADSYCAR